MRNEGRNPVTSRSVRSRQANIHQRCILISSHAMSHPYGPYPTPVGFEPTRGDPIGLAGRRLSRSGQSVHGDCADPISNMQTKQTSAPHASLDPLHTHLFFLCVPTRKSRRVSSAPRCFFVSREVCRRASPVALRRVWRGGRRGGLPSRRLRFNSWRCSPSCSSGRPALCGRRPLACRRRYYGLGKHSSKSPRC